MRVSLAEIGRRGRMDVTFTAQNGHTVLQDAYYEVPFKITRVLNSGRPTAHLILMQCTAGLFGGDELDCAIRVKRGARVLLTQQSATKIHPSRSRPAVSRMRIVVESGAALQFYQEPVIPFAASCLHQTTHIEIEPGGRLAFWEAFMAGRIGRGELWEFRELASETQVRLNGGLAYLDRFRLLPSRFVRSACAMGDYTYLGTGLYVGEQAREFASGLHQEMPEAGVDSPSADVAVARVVSAAGPEFHRSREVFRRLAANLVQL
jgi:urease accessory protein